jgi:hypothetical protein
MEALRKSRSFLLCVRFLKAGFMTCTKPAQFHKIGTFVAGTKAPGMALAFIVKDPATVGIFAHLEAAWFICNQ